MDFFASGDNGWNSDITIERKNVSVGALGDRLPVPVTISNLIANLSDSEDALVFGRYNFLTIQTVGLVRSVADESTEAVYVLQDPENREKEFEVIRFDSGEHQHNDFVDDIICRGTRVKLIGKLKTFDNVTKILAYMIHEICDDKDYRIFQLEAKVSKLFFEKNVIEKMRANQMREAHGMLAPPWTSAYIEHPPQHLLRSPQKPSPKRARIPESTIAAPASSSSTPYVKQQVASIGVHKGYTGMKAKAYGFLRSQLSPRGQYSAEEGVPFEVIFNKLKADKLSVKTVQGILDELIDDGSIFMTTEDYYAIIVDS